MSVSTTGSFQHTQQIQYQQITINNFKPKLAFYGACEQKSIAPNTGNTTQFRTYRLLGAVTTPTNGQQEGISGVPINVQDDVINCRVNQYSNFITFSDFLLKTDFVDTVAANARELGFMAGNTVDALTKICFEAAAGAGGTGTATNVLVPNGTNFSRLIASNGVTLLRKNNVPAKADGYYYGICHPSQGHDFLNENSTGGATDIFKFSEPDVLKNPYRTAQLPILDSVKWIQTTNVTSGTVAGSTKYNAFVVGLEGVFAVSLGNYEVPEDGTNFKVTIKTNLEPDKSDPEGKVGAFCSYNFAYGCTQRPGATMALARIQSEVSF
jgi:N4-gp56 family major capsid protein